MVYDTTVYSVAGTLAHAGEQCCAECARYMDPTAAVPGKTVPHAVTNMGERSGFSRGLSQERPWDLQ